MRYWLRPLSSAHLTKADFQAFTFFYAPAVGLVTYPTGYCNKRDMGDASPKRRILSVTWGLLVAYEAAGTSENYPSTQFCE